MLNNKKISHLQFRCLPDRAPLNHVGKSEFQIGFCRSVLLCALIQIF